MDEVRQYYFHNRFQQFVAVECWWDEVNPPRKRSRSRLYSIIVCLSEMESRLCSFVLRSTRTLLALAPYTGFDGNCFSPKKVAFVFHCVYARPRTYADHFVNVVVVWPYANIVTPTIRSEGGGTQSHLK